MKAASEPPESEVPWKRMKKELNDGANLNVISSTSQTNTSQKAEDTDCFILNNTSAQQVPYCKDQLTSPDMVETNASESSQEKHLAAELVQ